MGWRWLDIYNNYTLGVAKSFLRKKFMTHVYSKSLCCKLKINILPEYEIWYKYNTWSDATGISTCDISANKVNNFDTKYSGPPPLSYTDDLALEIF